MRFQKKESKTGLTEGIITMKKEQQKCSHKIKRELLPPLLLILVAGDMATIYPLIEAMFYQSMILSLAVTVIAGLVLEGIPCVAAHYILKKQKDRKDIIALAALGIAFLTVFILLFYLRLNSQDLQYQAAGAELSIEGVTDIVGSEVETVFTPTKGQKAMTMLLAFLPLITSVLALALSCAYRPEELKKERDELAEVKLSKLLADMEAYTNEVKKETERDLTAYDEALYQSRQEDLDCLAKMEKYEVRKMLAIRLGTPDAVSHLLEGGTKI